MAHKDNISILSIAESLPGYDPTSAYALDYTRLPIYEALCGGPSCTFKTFRCRTPDSVHTPENDNIPLLSTNVALVQRASTFISKNARQLHTIANNHPNSKSDYGNANYYMAAITLMESMGKLLEQMKFLNSQMQDPKSFMTESAAQLFDTVAGSIGVYVLTTWLRVKEGLAAPASSNAAISWVYWVNIGGKVQQKRIKELCDMFSETGFAKLDAKAKAAVISLPTGRFMVQLALILDFDFAQHTGKRITNFLDRHLSKGIPCKSPLCSMISPELQQKIGYHCTCGKQKLKQ